MGPYDTWHRELRSPTPEERRADRTTKPFDMQGFWRIEGARTKIDWPVAIFTNSDDIIIQIGERQLRTGKDDPDIQEFMDSSWLHCVAVGEGDYRAAMSPTGSGRWKDGKAARQISEDERLDIVPTTPAAEGGNFPEDVDQLHAQIVPKIEVLVEKAKAIGAIDTLDKANSAAAIIEQLRGLGQRGEAQRKVEKQPWLEGGAAVDQKWWAVRVAHDAVSSLLGAIDKFKRAERRRLEAEEAERQRLERERTAETMRAFLASEAAERQRKAEAEGETFVAPTPEDIAAEAEQIAADTVVPVAVEAPRVGTPFGRAISKPKVKTAVIYDAVAFFGAVQDMEDVREFMQKKANALARINVTLPGMQLANGDGQ